MSFAPEWLALREDADAEARAAALAEPLRTIRAPLVIHDLGCGTGSMGRWLAGRLDGPRHWVLHDRDPRLLAIAATRLTGSGVTVETREGDLAALRPTDLAGASLVTASALLDLLTADEVGGLAAACAGLPVLLTLSVTGQVEFDPPDPLDAEFSAAFNAHQRREVAGRGLLGPDAVPAATAAFERTHEVLTTPSPWRLGPHRPELTRQWLTGWVAAAREQHPDLDAVAPAYLHRRLDDDPRVTVHHADLLAIPRAS
ncbi:class I SAM-dependent methyltransferase [Actinokineospora sp. 24-640]